LPNRISDADVSEVDLYRAARLRFVFVRRQGVTNSVMARDRCIWPRLRRSLSLRCPNCGTGPLLGSYLKVRSSYGRTGHLTATLGQRGVWLPATAVCVSCSYPHKGRHDRDLLRNQHCATT
jgi:hypothetical protein